MSFKVIQYGLGAIGMEVARALTQRAGFELVGAIDVAADKVGKDLGQVLGVPSLRGIIISDKPEEVFEQVGADVVTHTTGSFLDHVYPQLETIIKARINVVSTTEELSFPWYHHPALAEKIEHLAQEHGVTVLGTGVNPGFVMDELVLSLASVCQKVEKVQAKRVLDAGKRRGPLQKKIGAGITEREFQERVKNKTIGHIGLAESVAFIAGGLGWKLESINETISPVLSEKDVQTEFVQVSKGQVAGIKMQAFGKRNGEEVIALELQMYVGAESSYDSIYFEGDPGLETKIEGGVPGDEATVAKIINSIPRVFHEKPGLLRPVNMSLIQI